MQPVTNERIDAQENMRSCYWRSVCPLVVLLFPIALFYLVVSSSTMAGAQSVDNLAIQGASGLSKANGDAFEPDDSSTQASWIGLDATPQTHFFHTPTDEDWASFYAPAGEIVTIETRNLGPNPPGTGDTLVQLYAPDGTTLLDASDDRGAGDLSSWLAYTVPTSGLYFVRVTNANPSASGPDTHYDLWVWRETPCKSGHVLGGRITDSATGSGVKSACVYVEEIGPSVSWSTDDNGNYVLTGLSVGTFTVHAAATGYADAVAPSATLSCGESPGNRDLVLQPLTPVLSVDTAARHVGANAGVLTLNVNNSGAGTMNWTAEVTQGVDWLSVGSGASGTDTGAVHLSYTTNLLPSERTGFVRIGAAGADNSPADVQVTQSGADEPGRLGVSVAEISLSLDAPSVLFMILNQGAGLLEWDITGTPDWLTVTPSQGAGQTEVQASAADFSQARSVMLTACNRNVANETVPIPVRLYRRGDINHDDAVDIMDVQIVINAALMYDMPYSCDMSNDGLVDALDVQLAINAALGIW